MLKRPGNDDKQPKRLKRFESVLAILNAGFILFAALLIIYLFFIQVVDLKHYRARAKSQRVGVLFSMRGDILDRNGITVARDKVYSDVYAHKKLYEDEPGRAKEIAHALAPLLEMPESVLLKKLNNQGPVITLKKNVDKTTAKKNKKSCIQRNKFGQDKLEHVINKVKLEKTRDGNIIYDFTTDPVATTTNPKGENVTLTLDAAIQHICEREIKKTVVEKNALRGTVIVMNPKRSEEHTSEL